MPIDYAPAHIQRITFVNRLLKFEGLPYIWGGDDPMAGFDCSGLVIEGLKAVGLFTENQDTTANGLMEMFEAERLEPGQTIAGALVFFINSTSFRASHVAAMIDDWHIIHAGGGGSANERRADAIRTNAYVKVRPLIAERDRRRRAYGQHIELYDPFKKLQ